MPLNPQQEAIISAGKGAFLVSAVPGSGKTTCVTHRIARLIKSGVPARNILALTFTNKAAAEMKERSLKLLPQAGGFPTVSTFHSFCAAQLRLYATITGRSKNFNILDQSDQEKLIRQTAQALNPNLEVVDKHYFKGIMRFLERTRENLEEKEKVQIQLKLTDEQVDIAITYLGKLPLLDAFDFSGLLLNYLQILKKYEEVRQQANTRYAYLMVDEFQDTNLIQYEIIKHLGAHGNIMVVGDLDQSIYGFRLALPENLLRFEKDFKAKSLLLETNYRSTPEILQVSQNLIEHNKLRKGTILKTENEVGEDVEKFSSETEFEAVDDGIRKMMRLKHRHNYTSLAVLYRTNAASLLWERGLRQCGVKYRLIGGLSFFARQEIKAAVAIMRALLNPKDSCSFLAMCETCLKGFGEKSALDLLLLTEAKKLPAEAAARLEPKPKMKQMLDLFDEARQKPTQDGMTHVLKGTGTWDDFQRDSTPDNDRCENLLTLYSDIEAQLRAGKDLNEYLQQASLISSADTETSPDAINLMTIHAAKGLEFDLVLISHMVEGLMPHSFIHSEENLQKALEEERRLLYVAMTRAKKKLLLSTFEVGRFNKCAPSRFIEELNIPRN